MASLIYLASPYSSINPAVREMRYERARVVTASLLKRGIPVFSPIVYGRAMEKIIGTDYISWKTFNDCMLDSCASMLVLTIDGWENSRGVAYEIDRAKGLKLPISYLADT